MTALPRCVVRGCPVRYRGGDNRICPWHEAEDSHVDLGTRARGFSVTMTAFDGAGSGHDTEASHPR